MYYKYFTKEKKLQLYTGKSAVLSDTTCPSVISDRLKICVACFYLLPSSYLTYRPLTDNNLFLHRILRVWLVGTSTSRT